MAVMPPIGALLPAELILYVFSMLDVVGILRARGVCRWWQRLADDPLSGRHLTAVLDDDRVPVVAAGLGAVVYRNSCSVSTLATVVGRYPTLRSLAVASVVSAPLYTAVCPLVPPDTLSYVNLYAPQGQNTFSLLALAHRATALVVTGILPLLLTLPNASTLRAVDITIYHNTAADHRRLEALIASMTSLRFLRLSACGDATQPVMAVPHGIDHLDVHPYRTTLPPNLKSAYSNDIDPRNYPSLRVLVTSRLPVPSFASLNVLVLTSLPADGYAALAALTNLRFLFVNVQHGGTAGFYDSVAALPLLVGLAVVVTHDNDDIANTDDAVVDASVVLPRVRRLHTTKQALCYGLPALPVVEVVLVDMPYVTYVYHGNDSLTPWTADERDLLLRTEALDAVGTGRLMTYDDHDPRCLGRPRCLGWPRLPQDATNADCVATLPLARWEHRSSRECSCQIMTHAS